MSWFSKIIGAQIMLMVCIIAFVMWLVSSCVSWVTSGDAGSDIGEFAGDVRDGFEKEERK